MKKSRTDILLAPIAQLSRWIKTRQLTVTEVVNTFIEQSEKINAETNSYQLTLFDEALEIAQEMDCRRGPRRGKLWGIPFTIKSQFDVENIPTTIGTTGRLYHPNFP
ncbi:MAG: amidase family protein, partial [Bacteroidota bacterium]